MILRYPKKARTFIKRRTNLFNDNIKLKLVPNRYNHFINHYLDSDGKKLSPSLVKS